MAGAVAVVDWILPGERGVVLALRIAVDVALGVAVFAGAGKALRVGELTDLLQLRRRPGLSGPGNRNTKHDRS
jgi:hypothetical protein